MIDLATHGRNAGQGRRVVRRESRQGLLGLHTGQRYSRQPRQVEALHGTESPVHPGADRRGVESRHAY